MKSFIDTLREKLAGERTEVMKILEKVPVFKDLSTLELKKIEIITHERNYLQDEVVFHEKEPGTGMYIIKKGSIRLTKKNNDKKEIDVALLKEGDFFGEIALLDEAPTAIAAEKTEVLGFYRPDFLSLLHREPKLGSKVLLELSQILATRLRQTTETSVKGAFNASEAE